jgi:hypothetical protein
MVRAISQGATCLVLAAGAPGSQAKNPWDINHGTSNPTAGAPTQPIRSGYVRAFSPGFWSAGLANTVPAGTVLSAILEDDLSSSLSKPGDIFALTLQDGFAASGTTIIPPGSKIIGVVDWARPAKTQRSGQPGRLEISLQALVFPDGSHIRIYAFLDSSLLPAQSAKTRHLGYSVADYGESVAAMFGSVLTGPGYLVAKRNRGQEFELAHGEIVPVRLSRSLTVAQGNQSSGQAAETGGTSGLHLDPFGPVIIPVARARAGTHSDSRRLSDENAVFNQPLQPATQKTGAEPF